LRHQVKVMNKKGEQEKTIHLLNCPAHGSAGLELHSKRAAHSGIPALAPDQLQSDLAASCCAG
jgi:hypothetical protein